jgi:hypothetical protein
MKLALIPGLLLTFALATSPSAFCQDIQSGMGREDTGAPPIQVAQQTQFQKFAEKLKLDSKTQVPAVGEIFTEALSEAAPVGQKMLVLRQQLVNVTLTNKPPDDQKPLLEAYKVEAAKMAGIEGRAFSKVYALLKPNQQPHATEAFALMAGIFEPQGGGGGGRARRGGGGR